MVRVYLWIKTKQWTQIGESVFHVFFYFANWIRHLICVSGTLKCLCTVCFIYICERKMWNDCLGKLTVAANCYRTIFYFSLFSFHFNFDFSCICRSTRAQAHIQSICSLFFRIFPIWYFQKRTSFYIASTIHAHNKRTLLNWLYNLDEIYNIFYIFHGGFIRFHRIHMNGIYRCIQYTYRTLYGVL